MGCVYCVRVELLRAERVQREIVRADEELAVCCKDSTERPAVEHHAPERRARGHPECVEPFRSLPGHVERLPVQDRLDGDGAHARLPHGRARRAIERDEALPFRARPREHQRGEEGRGHGRARQRSHRVATSTARSQ